MILTALHFGGQFPLLSLSAPIHEMGRCMQTSAAGAWKSLASFRAAWLLGVLVVLGGAGGCASGTFRAGKNVPSKWLAQRVDDPRRYLSAIPPGPLRQETIGGAAVVKVQIAADATDQPSEASVRVGETGTAEVPFAGTVRLAGLTLDNAEQVIARACIDGGYFRNPHVSVSTEERVNRVKVLGAVEKPNVYSLPRSSSYVLDALAQAGGLSENADLWINISQPGRGATLPDPSRSNPPHLAGGVQAEVSPAFGAMPIQEPRVFRVHLPTAAEEGAGDYYLEDGSVVVVGERPPRIVSVGGLVDKPGQYEFPYQQDVRLLDAVMKAGDKTSLLADGVTILRQGSDQSERVKIKASIREAKRNPEANLRLAAGDTVTVDQTPVIAALSVLERFVRVGVTGRVPLW